MCYHWISEDLNYPDNEPVIKVQQKELKQEFPDIAVIIKFAAEKCKW